MAIPGIYRVARFIGESYDSGTGNTREVTWNPLGQNFVGLANNANYSTQIPVINSIGFRLPMTDYSWFQVPSFVPAIESLIRNRSEYYWLTVTVTTLNGSQFTGYNTTYTYPIPPLGLVFLPTNTTAIVSVVGGNTLDSTQPVPTAGTQYLYLDFVQIPAG